ncbi:RNA-binding cell elongation regulator Jag/EloR [Pediococcus siamensis]|uniref:RNA-binding cell elongation regulator Jag/EloR n=1 Tax=Pediococcus siamensis TaxID=381829 RepID=UPI0039A16CF5
MAKYTGTTVEQAVQAGLADLNVSRSEVRITTLTEPKKGFLGIGKRAAEIEITVIDQPQKTQSQQAVKVTEPIESEVKPKLDEVDDEAKTEVQKPINSAPKQETVTGPKQEAVAQRPKLTAQLVEELQTYLLAVVSQLGITATATNRFHHREVTIAFKTEQEGLLIGKHGRTINSLQTLAQVFLLHHEIAHANVELDVENYRERRTETLQRLAENTAREVVATGDPVFLDPMPAFERKVIHAALAENHFVTTFSEGHEPHRYVVVALVQEEQL